MNLPFSSSHLEVVRSGYFRLGAVIPNYGLNCLVDELLNEQYDTDAFEMDINLGVECNISLIINDTEKYEQLVQHIHDIKGKYMNKIQILRIM